MGQSWKTLALMSCYLLLKYLVKMVKRKKHSIISKWSFKSKQGKWLLREIVYDFKAHFTLLDYGSDWLKLWFSKLNTDFEKLYHDTSKVLSEKTFMSSTSWNSLYDYKIFWNTFDIDLYKSPVGLTFKFSKVVDIYWISKNVSLFSIAVMQHNNFHLDENIILNIFWLAFQLHKLKVFDLNYLLKQFPVWKTTRLDWNLNFVVPENVKISDVISDLSDKFERSDKRFRNFYNETLIYNLYENSWVDKKKNKKRLRMTSRLWLRIYNKSKELYDDRIEGFYTQYYKQNILRFEFVLWSQYLNWFWLHKDYITVEEIFDIWYRKIFGNLPFTEYKLDRVLHFSNDTEKTEYYAWLLKRNKKDLESRLEWYIDRGWNLKEIIINWKTLEELLLEN